MGEIETNRLNFTEAVVWCRPAVTDLLVGNLIFNIRGLNRQMNASQNILSLPLFNKPKVRSVWIATTWFTSDLAHAWVRWVMLHVELHFSCFVFFPCILFAFCFSVSLSSISIFSSSSSEQGWLVSVDFLQTGFCGEGLYSVNKSDFKHQWKQAECLLVSHPLHNDPLHKFYIKKFCCYSAGVGGESMKYLSCVCCHRDDMTAEKQIKAKAAEEWDATWQSNAMLLLHR